MRRIALTLACATLATIGAVSSTPAASAPTAPTDTMPTAIWQRHACPTEDSINCYWNARTMGDGRGHSFYSVRVGNKRCVLFTATRFARHHNYCTTD